MKHWLKAVFVIVLIILILAACVSLDDGETTREVVVAEGKTAVLPTSSPNTQIPTNTPIPIFTPTRTLAPTDVPISTSLAASAWTPESSPAPRQTPTPLTLSELMWGNNVNVITSIDSDSVVWSPVINEFVLDHCSEYDEFDQVPDQFAFVSIEPNFSPQNITPSEITCSAYSYFEWRPDGQQILFNGLPILEANLVDSTRLYIMNRDGLNIQQTNAGGWLFEIYGWMDNDRLVKRSYRGGGNWIVSIFDIESDAELAWAWIYAHRVSEVDFDYVVTDSGDPGIYVSAAVFSETIIRPEEEPTSGINSRSGSGPNLNYLSFNNNEISGEPLESYFNSRFEDWISGTNQMLVITWEAYQRLFQLDVLHDSGLTDLKIWNVETNELTLVVPDGIYGRFSPNGHYLVFLTPSHSSPQLQLLDRISGKIILIQDSFAEISEFTGDVSAFTTFSPDGRFLTFFNPAHELIIYDLEKREFLAPLMAVPSEPLWSPDGSRFVYENPDAGLSIFDTRSAIAYPLTVSGSDRLLDPQWSYDGTYLSVTVKQEEWWARETAVLQIP